MVKNNVIAYTVDKAINNNLYISVQNGEVMVKAPWYFSKERIQEVVEEKKKWIIKKLEEYEKANVKKDEYKQSKEVKILGEKYQIKVIYKNIERAELNLEEKHIKIILPNKYKKIDNNAILKMAIEKMYSKIAETEIERAMEKTRIMLGFAPEDYEIVRMKNTLATCNQNKKIQINPDIVKYNRKIIDYVILHEFCHLKYKTHSKGFYKILEKYMPDYDIYANKISSLQY